MRIGSTTLIFHGSAHERRGGLGYNIVPLLVEAAAGRQFLLRGGLTAARLDAGLPIADPA
jgi:hypothetical protein